MLFMSYLNHVSKFIMSTNMLILSTFGYCQPLLRKSKILKSNFLKITGILCCIFVTSYISKIP